MNAFTLPPTLRASSLPQARVSTDTRKRVNGFTINPRDNSAEARAAWALNESQFDRQTTAKRRFTK